MADIRFDDRVAIVTGAGGGIGRSHALLLAERGAKVVVNDLGGNVDGSGEGTALASEVVEEIRSAGGTATPDFHPVDDFDAAEQIVQDTYDRWGRVDIVINNAGILRDRAFNNMTEDEFDRVYAVHLKGSFNVTKAAWRLMREQRYGRVILTSSGSGLFGNFGQANYGAMKAAMVGLMNVLVLEGQKYNILVNTVAPGAVTRMTKALLPGERHDILGPEHIAPAVVYMASEQCQDSGLVIQAAGGSYARSFIATGPHVAVTDGSATATLEQVDEKWGAITDISGFPDTGDLVRGVVRGS